MARRGARGRARIGVYLVEGIGCSGCVLEARAVLATRYAAAGQAIVLVGAPAHADLLLLCGTFPAPLAEEVQALAQALPEPWACLHLGDCGGAALFPDREVSLPGCPPGPEGILDAVRAAWRTRQKAKPAGPAPASGEEVP